MKTAVLITTYNREKSLHAIIAKISHQVDHIYIADDNSDYDIYHSLKDYRDKTTIIINGTHMGKAGYYKTVSRLFSLIQKKNIKNDNKNLHYDYYFMIPDDMMPADNWLEKSISLWESIDHPSKICLSIYSDASRFMLPCWSQFQPQMISDDIILSQWMDLCFIAEYRFFDMLGFQIPDPEIDYQEQPLMSSGVGRYISRNMNGMRQLMFHTVKSLMLPMDESQNSQMNANERAIHPKINKPIKLSQKKYAGLATIPGREEMMKKAVRSMLPQVDHIYISLNNYTEIPAWMEHKKITAILDDNSLGDSSKFAMAKHVDGFFFSIDDDLIYPPTYVRDMIKALRKRNWRALITHHGRNLHARPIRSYYKSYIKKIRCLEENNYEMGLDVPGSGVACWHTDFLEVDINQITTKNMGDIWLAKFCHEQKINICSESHPADYFTYLHPDQTIYEQHIGNDKIQTNLYNSIK